MDVKLIMALAISIIWFLFVTIFLMVQRRKSKETLFGFIKNVIDSLDGHTDSRMDILVNTIMATSFPEHLKAEALTYLIDVADKSESLVLYKKLFSDTATFDKLPTIVQKKWHDKVLTLGRDSKGRLFGGITKYF